jgi:hypothetical protein
MKGAQLFPIYATPMNMRSGMRRKRDLPSSSLMDRINGNAAPARYKKSGREKSLTAKVVVITLGLVLSLGGVSAAVAILVRGNSSTTDGVVSLGVGQAVANTCDTTTINTDTTSRWFDTYETFMIEKVELWGVDSACATKTLTLVMNFSSPYPDQTYTCVLPTTSLITGSYNLATFAFATSSIATTSTYYRCTNTLTLTTTSILAGTGVQIL